MTHRRHRYRTQAALLATAAFTIAGATSAARPGRQRRAPVAAAKKTAEAPPAAPAPAALAPSEGGSTKTIPVTVIEVAGAQAYLEPGTLGGVHRGAKVTINRREYTVVQATASFAAIAFGDDPPKERDKGRATPLDESATKIRELDAPTPLSTWRHAWTEPVPPASTQRPRFVPLGGAERDRRWDVRLSASTGALLPLQPRGSNLVRGQIDARIHAQPFEAPAAFDLDASLQRWFDTNLARRDGAQARPTLYVRELLASYGVGGYYGGIGRMRYAASTVGTLDGARASAPVSGGLTVGAFGGLLPDPLNGTPSVVASRFGMEATYSRPDEALRPDAALVVQGSTFDGKLDERRLSGVFSLYPGRSRLGGHFQVSAFDAPNPWNARPIELTAAGLDSSIRVGPFVLEGRFDARQPERSRWLASYLPTAWFCTPAPAAVGSPPGPERCNGRSSTLAYATADVGVEVDHASLFVGGARTFDLAASEAPSATGAFATGRVVRIAEVLRLDASGNYSKATYMDMLGGGGGPGLALLGDALDLSVYYRATTLRYRSVETSLTQHSVGGTVIVVPESSVLLALQGEAITGDDTRALVLFGTVSWRPNL